MDRLRLLRSGKDWTNRHDRESQSRRLIAGPGLREAALLITLQEVEEAVTGSQRYRDATNRLNMMTHIHSNPDDHEILDAYASEVFERHRWWKE
tara:strand:+ start:32 stop:313 length:282 start_codon:yes stop_codon:yes gene_type:complete